MEYERSIIEIDEKQNIIFNAARFRAKTKSKCELRIMPRPKEQKAKAKTEKCVYFIFLAAASRRLGSPEAKAANSAWVRVCVK